MSTVIEIPIKNGYAVNGDEIARNFSIDPEGNLDAVELEPYSEVEYSESENIYQFSASKNIGLFFRNKSGAAATVTIKGGDLMDGRSLKDLVVQLPNDSGASLQGLMVDPVYGFLYGRPYGKVELYVSNGPIECVAANLNPGFIG